MAELEAGPELDARIAQQVLGWKWYQNPGNQECFLFSVQSGDAQEWLQRIDTPPRGRARIEAVPAFSTDIAAAWLVVEHMRSLDWHYQLADGFDGQHTAVFLWGKSWWHDPDKAYKARATTLPLAVCRAALRAVKAK